jgi:hypothetical protein
VNRLRAAVLRTPVSKMARRAAGLDSVILKAGKEGAPGPVDT